jgi:hypothetical protein
MSKPNKMNALNALKEQMSPNDANAKDSPIENKTKQKSSNVPWYPVSPKLKKELKQLALDEDSSMNALISEGISLVFAKRGKDYNSYI